MITRPHDALFKAGFETPEHAIGLFRGILPAPIEAAIDWTTIALESGSFIDPDLADRHSDLLFSVVLGGRRALLYLLLEHQSRVAPDMSLRTSDYVLRIWKRRHKADGLPLPLIVSVTISHDPDGWSAPRSLHELIDPPPASIPGLAELMPNCSMLVLDLACVDDEQLDDWTLAALPKLVLLLLRDGRDLEAVRRDFVRWRELFGEVQRAPRGADAVMQVLRYIARVTGEMHFEEFREMIQTQIPEAAEIAMTVAEELHQQGLQQGLQQGRAETLIRQLTLKFGSVSPETLARIESADLDTLERYLERVLTVDSLEAVLAS